MVREYVAKFDPILLQAPNASRHLNLLKFQEILGDSSDLTTTSTRRLPSWDDQTENLKVSPYQLGTGHLKSDWFPLYTTMKLFLSQMMSIVKYHPNRTRQINIQIH